MSRSSKLSRNVRLVGRKLTPTAPRGAPAMTSSSSSLPAAPSLRLATLITLVIATTALWLNASCGRGDSDAPPVDTTLREDGSALTQINASSKSDWVYFDLDAPNEGDALSTGGWDLAFQRQLIKLNGGTNGKGGVAIALLDQYGFGQVDGVPEADLFFTDEGEKESDLAMSKERGWYSYNIIRHKLTPRERVYIVRSTQGHYYKLAMQGYYDSEDRGGYPSFLWARVNAASTIVTTPKMCVVDQAIREAIGDHKTIAEGSLMVNGEADGLTTITVDASLGGVARAATSSYYYVNLFEGQAVAVSDRDSREDRRWQLALKRSELRVNSGDSGAGQVRVARVDAAFEQAQVPALDDPSWRVDDFVSDTCELRTFGLDFLETAFGQWYDYDFEEHTVSIIPNTTYFVRDDARNVTLKLRIASYDEGRYTFITQELP